MEILTSMLTNINFELQVLISGRFFRQVTLMVSFSDIRKKQMAICSSIIYKHNIIPPVKLLFVLGHVTELFLEKSYFIANGNIMFLLNLLL